MKRAHRKTHLLIWVVLAPAIAAIIWLAISVRPAALANDALPAELIAEAD